MWIRILVAVALSVPAAVADDARSGYEFQSADVRSLQDDSFMNPGMLWVDRGQRLFEATAGMTGKSCADCHHQGEINAGSFPRINAHTGKLKNLTTQIQHCRTSHQGAAPLDYESEEVLALTVYLGHLQHGQAVMPVNRALAAQVASGRAYFERRKGQLNLACGQCHERNVGRMLRGDLLSQGQANGYPIYRLEWQTMGSLHRRLRTCDIGVRAEPHALGSEAYIELELFLKERAAGLKLETPAVRR